MSQKRKQHFRGGILSNLDSVLSQMEIINEECEERNTEIYEREMNKQTDYEFRGEFVGGKDLVITNKQDNFTLADVLDRRNKGKPIIPVAWHRPSGMWILTDADQAAVMSGYVCENCLEWQEVPGLRCNARGGFSCGYERPLM